MILPTKFTFSQGNLQDYVTCKFRFLVRYLQKIAWPAPITDEQHLFENQLQAGERFHQLVHQYYLGISAARLQAVAEADASQDMATWWHHFLDNFSSITEGSFFPESTLLTKVNNSLVVAKYDLVHFNGNQVWIYDWKTNMKSQDSQALHKRMQTRIYPWLLTRSFTDFLPGRILFPQQVHLVYWQANFPGEMIQFDYDEIQMMADTLYLQQLIDEIQSLNENDFFRTTDTRQCSYCMYRSMCNRGVKAGRFADLDDSGEEVEQDAFILDIDQVNPLEL